MKKIETRRRMGLAGWPAVFGMGALVGAAMLGCSKPEDAAHSGAGDGRKPLIYTVNYPLQYFAERIGGEAVEVRFPAPAGVDPAYWMPDEATVTAYQGGDLILVNGAGYGAWLDKVSLPSGRVVNTGQSFARQWIVAEDAITHSHGPEGTHAHGGTAFTTWLDPRLALEQARAVYTALQDRWPERQKLWAEGWTALERDLQELDRDWEAAIAPWKDRPWLFSHPVYQYFTRRYGLSARSVHWEPAEAPDEAMWAELRDLLVRHPATIMVWEGPPLAETERKLEALGLASVVLTPCANRPDDGDYLTIMRANVNRWRGLGARETVSGTSP